MRTYTLAEVRNGTGWPKGARFTLVQPARTSGDNFGAVAACRHCGQDIQFLGRDVGWTDRGGNRACVPYRDHEGEMVTPKTKHAPVRTK